ncbi:hypothetical protein [Elongatibacter sediminis]|uniref:Uncharacterized protein n=1 Tax=Elongatibacter sediminis TaxID=3119006 RepID=A0AAW9RCY9_9GAMM
MSKQHTLPAMAGRRARTRKVPAAIDHQRSATAATLPAAPDGVNPEPETPHSNTATAPATGKNVQADSWWSHAAYGLGATALVVPMFLPGRSMITWFLGYLTVSTAVFMGACMWGIFRALASGRQTAPKRRKSWPV